MRGAYRPHPALPRERGREIWEGLDGDDEPYGCALSGLGLDGHPPTDGQPTVLEIAQAKAGMRRRRVEASSVVVDFEDGLVAVSTQGDPAGCRLRVLANIGKRLTRELHQVSRTLRQLGGDRAIDVGHGGHAALLPEFAGKVLERLLELAIREDSRAQTEDVIAEVTNRSVDLGYRRLDARFHLGIAAADRGRLQAHPHRKQELDGAA